MKFDVNHPDIQDILNFLNITNLDDWDDANRYDDLPIEKLKSSNALMNRSATIQEAVLFFYLFLGRYEGHERAGRNNIDILSELLSSAEYNMRKLSRKICAHDPFTLKCREGNIILSSNGGIAHGQGVFSCLIEYKDGSLNVTFPENFHVPIFEGRFVSYLPIICESLKILKTIKSKTSPINFFYGDHSARDIGLAFCSNKTSDFLLPDSDVLPIFRNPPIFNNIPWEARKPIAYFRGSDTGASCCKSIDGSQRMMLCSLANLHPDLIDAKITNCENNQNIGFYKAKGVWGEREPLANIGLYKYNVDVDGNSNSWAGLVNKLYGGFGGVTLKVESSEGYRQWFYNRLQPWVNYVPIADDLSDIIDKINFLQKNDGISLGIQKNAANIFSGIDYEYLENYAAHIVVSALLRLR